MKRLDRRPQLGPPVKVKEDGPKWSRPQVMLAPIQAAAISLLVTPTFTPWSAMVATARAKGSKLSAANVAKKPSLLADTLPSTASKLRPKRLGRCLRSGP